MTEVLQLLAPAKVNLALEVTGRRDDGYHDIATVMVTLSLADRVRLAPRQDGAGVEVHLTGEHAGGIDSDDDLARRAAVRLAEATGRSPDVRIEIEKRIPSPAGLGGGSSDAAAVLRGLNRLWGLAWSDERLAALAATLGSDVPFFITAGAAYCTGRGEIVEPLRDLRPLRLLVLVPPVPAADGKTAHRYGALHPHDFTAGTRAERLSRRIARRAPPPTNDLVNVFERVIERTDPELVAHYSEYRHAGAPRLHLCGAGPAVFLFVRETAKVSELRRDFQQRGALVIDTQTSTRGQDLAIEAIGD